MLKLALAGLLASAFFSAAVQCAATKRCSSNNLLPTPQVTRLVKQVVDGWMSDEDFQLFKPISYRFQTRKNGGKLYFVKVKYGYLKMFIHLRIKESADSVILLTGIEKNKSKKDPISCLDSNYEKELTRFKNSFSEINFSTTSASETNVTNSNSFLWKNELVEKNENLYLKVLDEWQCCQPNKDFQDSLTEDYNTIEMVALKQKIKEMVESAWNRFLQNSGNPAAPQIKFQLTPRSWLSWPLEWDASKMSNHGWSVFSRNDFWCPGATLVTALDSFIIMNLTHPAETGKKWISTQLSTAIAEGDLMNVKRHIPTYIGSLLSIYFLTNDTVYKNLAIQLGNKLLLAYNHKPNGLPSNWYRTKSLKTEAVPVYDVSSYYSALNFEFLYLSSISGNQEYRTNIERILEKARNFASEESLKPRGMFRNTGTLPFWEKTASTWPDITAQSGGNYLDYLYKSWMMGNREDDGLRKELIQMTDQFIQDFVKRKGILTYVSVLSDEPATDKNKHGMALSTCYTGGLFALIGASLGEPYQKKYLTIGKNIVDTCREVHTSRPAMTLQDRSHFYGLPSELFFIIDGEDVFNPKIIHADRGYRQTGETAESYFILWRLTHNIKYRKWGWELAKSIFKSTNGATNPIEGITTVLDIPDGYQHQALLSETYKYLYLLFCEDSVFPLDKWIFNANGHPLPIKGTLPSF